tara:strand:+ start:378 stop:1145 length:768 start_codon:yes stop_codon:yes gene_type:complete
MNKTIKNLCMLVLLTGSANLFAQPPGAQNGPPPSAQESAPFDVEGYWVSVVTEDWRWRMMVPPAGDFGSIPLNDAGEELALAWAPNDSDIESCLAFGGAGIIRYPGRLHISWQDEETLRIDFSAGSQTRLLHFDDESNPESVDPSLQGHTVAHWYKEPQTRGLGFGGRPRSFEGGNLRTVTSRLSPAFLQRNGIPYSAETEINDFYRVVDAPNGDRWLIVTSIITDPVYLSEEVIWSTHFKYEENGSNWEASECN